MTTPNRQEPIKIRLVNAKHDLNAVADLIEQSFIGYLDTDGKNYIQQIRRAAQNPRYRVWYPGAGEWVSSLVFGYVCEIGGKLVGNLSLIPYHNNNKWLYLIANVAVHPEYRRQGIAKKLTTSAIKHVRQQGVAAVWLQVRADNDIAIQLYKSLGFIERARRTNWLYENKSKINSSTLPENISIVPRVRSHWFLQKQWLNATYPPEIAWYLSFSQHRLSPSILHKISQTMMGSKIRHWSACLSDQLVGVLTWQPTNYYADNLWLATSEKWQDISIKTLIPQAIKELDFNRPLVINFPAGRAESSFQEAHFTNHNTLIWMRIQF